MEFHSLTCPHYITLSTKFQLIERKGADIMVTRDCLSNLEGFRTDIPADKYEGCRSASHDVKLGQYTFNRIKGRARCPDDTLEIPRGYREC